MAFVRGYKHDIFVSYAHVDNQIWTGADEGWVTNLVKGLKIRLAQMLGRADVFSLWMDQTQLPGHKSLTPEIIENLQQSATLLIILSPGYVASTWCIGEKNAFLAAAKAWPNSNSRVFIVERIPVDADSYPVELADLVGYGFWSADSSGTARTISVVPPRFEEDSYYKQIDRLASELAKELKTLSLSPAVDAEPKRAPRPRTQRTRATVVTRDRVETRRKGEAPGPKESRCVEPLSEDLRSPDHSAGLFVGVGDFDKRSHLTRLAYAPDDAVTLAHLFVIELELISPGQARIALGGDPSSERARQCMENLKAVQAAFIPASKTDLLYAVEETTAAMKRDRGLVVMTFSTHGYEENGIAYLMPSDGIRRFVSATGLPTAMIYQSLHSLKGPAKLLIIDACRASMEGGARGEEVMSDRFLRALNDTQGLALLTSCGVAQLSWESPQLEQGVFTHFLVEGLRGGAPARKEDGLLCLENVFSHTLEETNKWVRQHIRSEQLPWYGGEDELKALPLGVLREAKERAEFLRRQREELEGRKERALRCLLTARMYSTNRSLISASLQEEVEKGLERLQDEKLEELLENLEKLADKKLSSCKMFASWWKVEHSTTLFQPLTRPNLLSPWINSLGMKFVPVESVLVGAWQVRVQDFMVFVNATNHNMNQGMFFSMSQGTWKHQGHSWMKPGFEQDPSHPAAGISWEDAAVFCRWMTAKERAEGYLSDQQCYRLPTDAEWSRTVGNTRFPWGNDWPPPPEAGNYVVSRSRQVPLLPDQVPPEWNEISYIGTTPVAAFPPNSLGIYDLAGNVWEWCSDWYRAEMNPAELRNTYKYLDEDGGGTAYHFVRGGSWYNYKILDLLTAYRNAGKFPDARFANVGFRCLLDVGPDLGVQREFHF